MTTNESSENTGATNGSKKEESDVYDRQIRLWGADAQAKMAKTQVLYIHVTGVSSEILKNLVLAGIRATLFDPRPYPDAVAHSPSFLLASQKEVYGNKQKDNKDDTEQPASKKAKTFAPPSTVAEAVQPVVEDLNPLLGACPVITKKTVEELIADPDLLSQFRIVVASRLAPSQAIAIAKATTAAGGHFFLADSFGLDAACLMDLGSTHTFRPELGKKLLDPTSLKEKNVSCDTLLNQVPLHQAVNRFHKKRPPTAWMRYRAILEYAEQQQQENSWPSTDRADDFCQVVQKWIEKESPSLAKEEDVFGKDALIKLAKVADGMEIAPVCSVLGGVVGNEVIKAISGKGQPANNTLLLDGATCKVWSFLVQPKKA